MNCVRSLRYHDHVLPVRSVTEALAPKKKPLKRTLSLRLNKGILPRPFQSRARRNIMRQLRTYRNMVRIMGVEDPAQNWISLDTIHSVPLNRVGNPHHHQLHASPGKRWLKNSRNKPARWLPESWTLMPTVVIVRMATMTMATQETTRFFY